MPARARDTPGKVATPPAALRVVVPDSVPPPELVPTARVMLAVDVVTRLPAASCTLTSMAGAKATPADEFPGWTVKASWEAAPAVTLKASEVTAAIPFAVATSVYPVPTLSSVRVEKVARALADVVVVEPNAPLDDVIEQLEDHPGAVALVIDHGSPLGMVTREELDAYLRARHAT